MYSCIDSVFISNGLTTDTTITCLAPKSCANVDVQFVSNAAYLFGWINRVHLYSALSGLGSTITALYKQIYVYDTLSLVNSTITMGNCTSCGWNGMILYVYADYGLVNVTITCDAPADVAKIYCVKQNSPQYVIIDNNCEWNNCSDCKITNCVIINATDEMDNESVYNINTTLDIYKEFESIYEIECSAVNYKNYNYSNIRSILFDIGYPLYGELSIINTVANAAICCRGYESCAFSRTIYSNVGNIYCTGGFSCSESGYMYTGTAIDINDEDTNAISRSGPSIFCMGYNSCAGSSMKSANKIICGGYLSCDTVEIIETSFVYCSYQSCNHAIFTQVETIYIFSNQSYISIYSGGIKTSTNIHLRGTDAASQMLIICTNGDTCHINCGYNSCSNKTTMIYCYGKCFITCNGVVDSKNCVNIVTSLSPTISPTMAPTLSPTDEPTDTPTVNMASMLITQENIRISFQWTLFFVVVFVTAIAMIGYIDSRKCRQNESFKWTSICMFGICAIDFVSDLFFGVELFVFIIDDQFEEYYMIYTILFGASVIFIVLPMIINLIQLHNELSKWITDPILSHTEVPLWILTYVKMLYFISVITGSSFNAVSLLNSNLFQWPIFEMGLSRFHRARFQNKRFFSIVLLEVCVHVS